MSTDLFLHKTYFYFTHEGSLLTFKDIPYRHGFNKT